ncbi:MAG: YidC/Oxa1 family membrane protein insertase [Lachnospiraceae bacterium]|nr:YidC/Oxa1 family membrane protein insertase [Lachnospiraceae bacterium]
MLLTQNTNFILRPFSIVMGYILQGIFWVLDLFMEYPSIGIAIILFTIIVYVLMLPLTVKQQKFSKLSGKMNPELQEIQAKYKGKTDQESMQKMNLETQAVYAKYGVNPSGSCLQLLIQMPILFALYRVIYSIPAYVPRIKESFFPLVDKLSAKIGTNGFLEMLQGFSGYSRYVKQVTGGDFVAGSEAGKNTLIDLLNSASTKDWDTLLSTYPELATDIGNTHNALDMFNRFLGLNIADSPSFVISTQWSGERNMLMIIGVLMIPLLAAVTQWINTKLIPQTDNGKKEGEENAMVSSMKTMNTVMPLMSAFFCFTLPIGIGIYWIAGSVVRSIIQICVNKHLDKIDVDEMIKNNVEKNNEKRRKQGLPPQQISTNATRNTKSVEVKKTEPSIADKEKLAKNVKESTEFYNKNSEKPGSLASKAAMVKAFNEKNNKN